MDVKYVKVSDLKIHPQAGLIPEMPEERKNAFFLDIAVRGILEPLIVTRDYIIINGRHRYWGAIKNGIELVPCIISDANDSELLQTILQDALSQKSLTGVQRIEIYMKLTEVLAEKAKENQKRGGKGEVVGESDKVDRLKTVAEMTGISRDTVAKVNKIQQHGSFICEDSNGKQKYGQKTVAQLAREDKLSINEAYKQVQSRLKAEERKRKFAAVPNIPLPVPTGNLTNQIVHMDVLEGMAKIEAGTVHLLFTSPPYPLKAVKYPGWEYDGNYRGYLNWIKQILKEAHRVLTEDGRLAINIPEVSSFSKDPKDDSILDVPGHITRIAKHLGFRLRNRALWYKQKLNSNRPAKGSAFSAENPSLMWNWEYVLIFDKGCRSKQGNKDLGVIPDDQFNLWTNGFWDITAANPNITEHRCAFPEELARRVIKLFSYEGDTVLDPFSGSGTTCRVAKGLRRNYIGIDNDEIQVKKSIQRMDDQPYVEPKEPKTKKTRKAKANNKLPNVPNDAVSDAIAGTLGLPPEGEVAA